MRETFESMLEMREACRATATQPGLEDVSQVCIHRTNNPILLTVSTFLFLASCSIILAITPPSECQLDDWKKGSDVHCAHKWICGKRLSDDFPHHVLIKKKIVAKVPLPDPGFTRSPALLQQISFLEQPKMIDYVVSCEMDYPCFRFADLRASLYAPLRKKS